MKSILPSVSCGSYSTLLHSNLASHWQSPPQMQNLTDSKKNTEVPRFVWGMTIHKFYFIIITIKDGPCFHLSAYKYECKLLPWQFKTFYTYQYNQAITLLHSREQMLPLVINVKVWCKEPAMCSRTLSDFQSSFSVSCLSSFPRFDNDLHSIAQEKQSQQETLLACI